VADVWNDSIKLPNGYTETTDVDGFILKTPLYISGIPANFLSATRSDETLANQIGYTADVIIEIMECNYSGQNILIDEKDEKEYEIKRSHKAPRKEIIQLTCQRR
jgi:hypothetical protein